MMNGSHLAVAPLAVKIAIFVRQRPPFLLFPVRGSPIGPGFARHQEEGEGRAAQSSASLLISYIGGSESMCTRLVELVCEQAYVRERREYQWRTYNRRTPEGSHTG